MADTRDIEKVLTLLSLSEEKKDLVAFALDDAEEIILNYCHIDKIPEKLHQTMLRMALDLYRAEKIGDSEAVGTLSSVTVGDTSTSFNTQDSEYKASVLKTYETSLKAFRKVKFA